MLLEQTTGSTQLTSGHGRTITTGGIGLVSTQTLTDLASIIPVSVTRPAIYASTTVSTTPMLTQSSTTTSRTSKPTSATATITKDELTTKIRTTAKGRATSKINRHKPSSSATSIHEGLTKGYSPEEGLFSL